MKANQPKRKLFNDAVDLLTGDAPDSGIQMILVDQIKPFHEHPFRLYQGERLDDMVESIREHGILTPVIVRKLSSGYEMLAGHNRQNAARIAGLKEIPAIVKENLTDEEACVFFVADQPFFREETAEGFLMEMEEKQARLGCVVFGEQMGNPVWFGREYFEELRQLTGDQGGRKVFRRYPEAVCFYRVQDAVELKDIDYLTEMPGKVAMKEESK